MIVYTIMLYHSTLYRLFNQMYVFSTPSCKVGFLHQQGQWLRLKPSIRLQFIDMSTLFQMVDPNAPGTVDDYTQSSLHTDAVPKKNTWRMSIVFVLYCPLLWIFCGFVNEDLPSQVASNMRKCGSTIKFWLPCVLK